MQPSSRFNTARDSRNTLRGIVYGCAAAVCYGTNPLGALFLYREGLSPESVLCYRFFITIILLAFLMVMNRSGGQPVIQKFAIHKRELPPLVFLGFLFAISALGLYASFNYMDAGLASTLLFLYPLEVALIMAVFFKEKMTRAVGLAIAISLLGIGLLYRGGEGGAALSLTGLLLVFASSLAYAVYIVVVNKADLKMGSMKLTFYVMIFCLMFLLLYSVLFGAGFPPVLQNPSSYGWACMLGLVPTVLSLVLMAKAVKIVGSTPTAIMGGLEPLTAVVIGVCVFGETLTVRLICGIILVLLSVLILAVKKN